MATRREGGLLVKPSSGPKLQPSDSTLAPDFSVLWLADDKIGADINVSLEGQTREGLRLFSLVKMREAVKG